MHRRRLLLPLSALLLFAPSAEATVMVRLDLDTLVGRSDQVVLGKVRSKTSRWSSEARKRIVTDTEIVVEENIHGQAVKVLTVRTMGGVVNGIGMRVIGTAHFRVGERVLAFTEKRGAHRWVVGMRQGLFRVAADAQGKRVVNRSVRGLSLMRHTAKGLKRAPSDELDAPLPLRSFIDKVRARAKACAQRSDGCLPPTLRRNKR